MENGKKVVWLAVETLSYPFQQRAMVQDSSNLSKEVSTKKLWNRKEQIQKVIDFKEASASVSGQKNTMSHEQPYNIGRDENRSLMKIQS